MVPPFRPVRVSSLGGACVQVCCQGVPLIGELLPVAAAGRSGPIWAAVQEQQGIGMEMYLRSAPVHYAVGQGQWPLHQGPPTEPLEGCGWCRPLTPQFCGCVEDPFAAEILRHGVWLLFGKDPHRHGEH